MLDIVFQASLSIMNHVLSDPKTVTNKNKVEVDSKIWYNLYNEYEVPDLNYQPLW